MVRTKRHERSSTAPIASLMLHVVPASLPGTPGRKPGGVSSLTNCDPPRNERSPAPCVRHPTITCGSIRTGFNRRKGHGVSVRAHSGDAGTLEAAARDLSTLVEH